MIIQEQAEIRGNCSAAGVPSGHDGCQVLACCRSQHLFHEFRMCLAVTSCFRMLMSCWVMSGVLPKQQNKRAKSACDTIPYASPRNTPAPKTTPATPHSAAHGLAHRALAGKRGSEFCALRTRSARHTRESRWPSLASLQALTRPLYNETRATVIAALVSPRE